MGCGIRQTARRKITAGNSGQAAYFPSRRLDQWLNQPLLESSPNTVILKLQVCVVGYSLLGLHLNANTGQYLLCSNDILVKYTLHLLLGHWCLTSTRMPPTISCMAQPAPVPADSAKKYIVQYTYGAYGENLLLYSKLPPSLRMRPQLNCIRKCISIYTSKIFGRNKLWLHQPNPCTSIRFNAMFENHLCLLRSTKLFCISLPCPCVVLPISKKFMHSSP